MRRHVSATGIMAGSMATSITTFEQDINARLRAGDLPGAAAAAAACRAALPEARAGWYFGSVAALLAGRTEEAQSLADQWLQGHPGDPEGLLQCAECHLARGDRAAAMAAAAAAIEASTAPEVWDAIGTFLFHAAEYPLAVTAYDRALTARPADIDLLAKRAVIHRSLGRFTLAERDFRAVLLHKPNDADTLKALVELERQTPERNDLASMEQALGAVEPTSKDAATLHFALAKAHDDLGDYPASWRHLCVGNRIERAGVQYDPATDQAVIERLIAGFANLEPTAPDTTGEAPIFIVGLPRTGTTLVERIIGRHSMVHAAGELPAMTEAVGLAVRRASREPPRDWPQFAARFAHTEPAVIAREYLAFARSLRGDRPRFSDKQPTNFFFCPLILRAFPQARIVHLTRHPLAACYAIFKTRFTASYPFSRDLRELALFYLGYRRLMAHWHRILPGRIYDVAYEDLVTELEPTVRGLLEHLGLPFEPQCLEFHRNPAPTSTASVVQVRQPLYDTSLSHWQHYEQELGELAKQLRAGGIDLG